MVQTEDQPVSELEAPEDGLVFEPDILQREQWNCLYQAASHSLFKTPEHRLYLAIFEDALHTLCAAREDALLDLRRWLTKPERQDVRVNLQMLCDVLSLDCAAVQQALLPHVMRGVGERGQDEDEGADGGVVSLSGLVRKCKRAF